MKHRWTTKKRSAWPSGRPPDGTNSQEFGRQIISFDSCNFTLSEAERCSSSTVGGDECSVPPAVTSLPRRAASRPPGATSAVEVVQPFPEPPQGRVAQPGAVVDLPRCEFDPQP